MRATKRKTRQKLRRATTYLMDDEWDFVVKTAGLLQITVSNLLASLVIDAMWREMAEVDEIERMTVAPAEVLPW